MSPPPRSLLRLSLLLALSLLPPSLPQPQPPPPPSSILIDCGAAAPTAAYGLPWQADAPFVSSGAPRNLAVDTADPTLATVRSFPNLPGRKFCYVVDVVRGARYMVRSTYFYGGVNGVPDPPVFDQIVDGTLWAVVNTTGDYRNDDSTYYEGVFMAQGKTMSFCVGANVYTESDPFISALEFVPLGDSVYNSTDFGSSALSLVARNSFGDSGDPIRFPDDQFDRLWVPFGGNGSSKTSNNLTVSGFWNLPPLKVFETELTATASQPLELQWPLGSLQNGSYYIALYFANDHDSVAGGSRIQDITVNGFPFYSNLNVTSDGVAVFTSNWPLVGLTKINLVPTSGSTLGPLINAGEAFQVLPLGRVTHTRDVIALEKLKLSLHNHPIDWSGDPCLPQQYSWTGVTCSQGGRRIRVVALNLTGIGLYGSLSPYLANMTALTGIWLGNNHLYGPIPNLSALRNLEILHLNDNELNGPIPSSLGAISGLKELFLQNNNLTGQVPSSLLNKPGLNLK
ncbi:putative leucine-rich repeat receptor-like serine/threonine-protein kinase At2g14440 isoform X2 [Syzygium oleosum]|nr:putative leucine-rich repeat receptor-like serine/threonine-protein kinase At2g14440 isoform X2 [Syzygium oleosum]